jgi:hypothetical protein
VCIMQLLCEASHRETGSPPLGLWLCCVEQPVGLHNPIVDLTCVRTLYTYQHEGSHREGRVGIATPPSLYRHTHGMRTRGISHAIRTGVGAGVVAVGLSSHGAPARRAASERARRRRMPRSPGACAHLLTPSILAVYP